MNTSIAKRFKTIFATEGRLDVASWRSHMLNLELYIFFALGTLATLVSTRIAISRGQLFMGGVFLFFYALLLTVTFVKTIPYNYRAGILVLSMFLLGVLIMRNDGLVGSGRIWLLVFSVITVSLFGFRGGIVAFLAGTVAMWVYYFAAASGRLEFDGQSLNSWLVTSVTFTMMNAVITFTLGSFFKGFEENLNDLLDLAGNLEKRVESRVRDLSTLIAVSNKLAAILDEQTLVAEVVNQIQSAFHYYHVHIYTLDEACEYLVMAGGTGKAGLTMLAQGHKIPFGKGLVGRAAKNNQPVLVSDVSQDPNWLPNPLLPETKAETAVPISLENDVLGVLDVQHNVVGGLKEEDVSLLQSVANQVAIALRNAHLYEDVRQKALQESRLNEIGHEIQQAANIEAVLETAVRELGKTLKAPKVAVVLDQQTLRSYDKN
jgi:putative methionine-R-sulfoxide reductase with GAF domain